MNLLPQESLIQTSRVDHADWNYRPLLTHLMRRRFALILRLLPPVPVDDMLEVGFGSGIFLPELATRSRNLYGVDVHDRVAEVQEKIARHGVRARLVREDASAMSFPDASFDVIVAVSALEFIQNIDGAAREFARVLKPGGRLVAVMPAASALLDVALRFVTGQDANRDYEGRRECVVPALCERLEVIRTRKYLHVYKAYEFGRKLSTST